MNKSYTEIKIENIFSTIPYRMGDIGSGGGNTSTGNERSENEAKGTTSLSRLRPRNGRISKINTLQNVFRFKIVVVI